MQLLWSKHTATNRVAEIALLFLRRVNTQLPWGRHRATDRVAEIALLFLQRYPLINAYTNTVCDVTDA